MSRTVERGRVGRRGAGRLRRHRRAPAEGGLAPRECERLLAAIEVMPQAFALWDEEERLVLCNERFRRLYPGLEDAIRPGASFAQFAHTFSRSAHVPDLSEEERAERAGRRIELFRSGCQPWVGLLRDGRWVEGVDHRMPDGGTVSLRFDVTRRIEAEEALRASEQRFRDVVDAASDWIWETDSELRFTFFSERLREVTGLDPKELIGRARWEVASYVPGDPHWERHIEDLRARRPFRDFRYGVQTDGGRRELAISGVPVLDAQGCFRGYRGTGRDVTAERQAQEAQRRLAQAVEAMADGFALFDAEDRLVVSNTTFRDIHAQSPEHCGPGTPFEAVLRGGLEVGVVAPELVEGDGVEGYVQRRMARHRLESSRLELRLPDGRWMSVREFRLADGGIAGIWSDVTALKLREQELQRSEARLRGIMNAVADGIVGLDEQGAIESANPGAEAILGLQGSEVRGRPLEHFIQSRSRRLYRRMLRRFLQGAVAPGACEAVEIMGRRLDGTPFPAELALTHSGLESGPCVIATLRDIGARKEAERLIRYQATHDTLTGLPNRVLFHDRLATALRQAERRDQKMAVLFLDLDRFKVINDTLGHAVGDALLTEVAGRLRAGVRQDDTVARMGGDEFILLLTGLGDIEEALEPARRIQEALRPGFRLDGHELHVAASIGIAFYPDDGRDADTLLRNADVALYRVKARGRGGIQLYSPAMNARALERMLLENALRQAIERGELLLQYQAQVDLATGRCAGVEALVRWHHPTRGLVPPDDFIPLAEESGLIVQMGAWILRAACMQDRLWREAGVVLPRLSVNMSGRQFQQGDILAYLQEVLEASGMDPSRLELEITESILMQEDGTTARTIERLMERGVTLAMDDFGTGYSSLGYLKRFPFSRVKIDRGFIQDMARSECDAALVRATVAMAHGLGLRVVAEGVESREQLERLLHYGCDEAQGFLLSRPLPADGVPTLLGRCLLPSVETPKALELEAVGDT